MVEPSYGYADSEGLDIAYMTVGGGPIDVVVVTGLFGHVGMMEELPWYREVLERVPQFARLIALDKRGEGLSDGGASMATYEDGVADIVAVMDEVESESAVVLVSTDACPLGILFAATHPDRVRGLFCREGWARLDPSAGRFLRDVDGDWWGTGQVLSVGVSGAVDGDELRRAAGRWERGVATPRRALARFDLVRKTDVRSALPLVTCPTMVVQYRGDGLYTPSMGRHVADEVADGRHVELPYDRIYTWSGEGEHAALDVLEGFLTELVGKPVGGSRRALLTVVFVDVVASTQTAASLGDREWSRRLDRLDTDGRRLVESWGGETIKSTGDGLLAVFDGPGRALEAAVGLQSHARAGGLELRCGVHTGEVTRRGDDVAGLAVHLASRIESEAAPGQVLVSRTVVDLTIGSPWRFESVGTRTLKGFDRDQELFAVVDPDE